MVWSPQESPAAVQVLRVSTLQDLHGWGNSWGSLFRVPNKVPLVLARILDPSLSSVTSLRMLCEHLVSIPQMVQHTTENSCEL